MQRDFNFFAKMAKFRQICTHCLWTTSIILTYFVRENIAARLNSCFNLTIQVKLLLFLTCTKQLNPNR